MKLIRIFTILTLTLFLVSACKKLVEVELPNSRITSGTVFAHDETAIAAASGIYVKMVDPSSFAGGAFSSITYLTGLSSDELTNYDFSFTEIANNNIRPSNPNILNLWQSAYNTIYEANALLEGVESSATLTAATKQRLEGEARFIRAFCHFYLVNLFGDVPLVVSTDYETNATLARSAAEVVYTQIVEDLTEAKNLLSEEYYLSGRTRPNKFAAAALLARVFLYIKDYPKAEEESTKIIDATSIYSLVNNLSEVFLANSNEAIWQLSQSSPGVFPTWDALNFIIRNSFFTKSLSETFAGTFESDDLRKDSWVGTFVDTTGTYFFPYKYKVRVSTEFTEFLMVLRLAEQYLIRAEARAQQDNITGSQSDINEIRHRAGLATTSANDRNSLLQAIEQERRVELFCEFGHRWLDIKRTGRVETIMSHIKQDFLSHDALFPIPESDLLNDPNLVQTPGY